MLAHRFRLSKKVAFTSFCSTSTEQRSRSPVIKRRRLVALAKDNPPIKKAIGCAPCHAQPLQSPSPPTAVTKLCNREITNPDSCLLATSS